MDTKIAFHSAESWQEKNQGQNRINQRLAAILREVRTYAIGVPIGKWRSLVRLVLVLCLSALQRRVLDEPALRWLERTMALEKEKTPTAIPGLSMEVRINLLGNSQANNNTRSTNYLKPMEKNPQERAEKNK